MHLRLCILMGCTLNKKKKLSIKGTLSTKMQVIGGKKCEATEVLMANMERPLLCSMRIPSALQVNLT